MENNNVNWYFSIKTKKKKKKKKKKRENDDRNRKKETLGLPKKRQAKKIPKPPTKRIEATGKKTQNKNEKQNAPPKNPRYGFPTARLGQDVAHHLLGLIPIAS
jgi:hypothetical protein